MGTHPIFESDFDCLTEMERNVPFSEIVKSFKPAKKYTSSARINSLSFSFDGEHLISANDNDELEVFQVDDGALKRTLHSKKYGVANVNYTHHHTQVIYSSTKSDHAIRYHSLHHNAYIRHFPGHTDRVTSLEMSPIEDQFLSCSLDRTLRLWDLRKPTSAGVMEVGQSAVGCFDPEGIIFAAGVDSETIKLYDLRTFGRGPFSTFKLTPDRALNWISLKFSLEGNAILISTNGQSLKVVDAFDGTTRALLGGHKNTRKLNLKGTFSPCGELVLSGSEDGFIHMWNSKNGDHVGKLDGQHPNAVTSLAFNPFFDVIASSCTHMCLWLPDEQYD